MNMMGSIYKASRVTATKTNKYGDVTQRSMPSYQVEISHEHDGINIQSFYGDSYEDKQIWIYSSNIDAILPNRNLAWTLWEQTNMDTQLTRRSMPSYQIEI